MGGKPPTLPETNSEDGPRKSKKKTYRGELLIIKKAKWPNGTVRSSHHRTNDG